MIKIMAKVREKNIKKIKKYYEKIQLSTQTKPSDNTQQYNKGDK